MPATLALGLDQPVERVQEVLATRRRTCEVAAQPERAPAVLDHLRGSRPSASGRCRCGAGAAARGRAPRRAAGRPRSSRRRPRPAAAPCATPTRSRIACASFLDVARHRPVGRGSRRCRARSCAIIAVAVRGVVHLGVELEAVAALAVGADGRVAVVRLPVRRRWSSPSSTKPVADARPPSRSGSSTPLDRREPGEQRATPREVQVGRPRTRAGRAPPAAVRAWRSPGARSRSRGSGCRGRRSPWCSPSPRREASSGAAREDDAPGSPRRPQRVVRLADLGEHPQPPDLGGNQVGVLAAEIDDGNPVVHDGRELYPHVRANDEPGRAAASGGHHSDCLGDSAPARAPRAARDRRCRSPGPAPRAPAFAASPRYGAARRAPGRGSSRATASPTTGCDRASPRTVF